jgi:hypothetical protein
MEPQAPGIRLSNEGNKPDKNLVTHNEQDGKIDAHNDRL